MSITRRRWLQTLTGLPVLSWWSGCTDEQPEATNKNLDEKSLAALVDTIIPADNDPGAVDAGIHMQLLEKIRADRWQYALYSKGLAVFNKLAHETHGRDFTELELDARTELLMSLVRDMHPEHADGRRCFIAARYAVLDRFYNSPMGWQVLAYTPPNNGYDD